MRIAGNRPAQKQCRERWCDPLRKESPAGALVYRQKTAEVELLLLKHRFGGHWSFPKGHVEEGETEVETALREVHEETGLTIRLEEGFRQSVEYYPRPNIRKQVVYFLGYADDDRTRRQEEEIVRSDGYR